MYGILYGYNFIMPVPCVEEGKIRRCGLLAFLAFVFLLLTLSRLDLYSLKVMTLDLSTDRTIRTLWGTEWLSKLLRPLFRILLQFMVAFFLHSPQGLDLLNAYELWVSNRRYGSIAQGKGKECKDPYGTEPSKC